LNCSISAAISSNFGQTLCSYCISGGTVWKDAENIKRGIRREIQVNTILIVHVLENEIPALQILGR